MKGQNPRFSRAPGGVILIAPRSKMPLSQNDAERSPTPAQPDKFHNRCARNI
jgi:hypothetical protein